MTAPLRIGTRGSPLALAQARMVADALRRAHGWDVARIAIVPITTTGDIIQDRPLAEVGGKALWTKELDRCLLERRTDLSVHSMKDVETFRPETLAIAAMLPRADVRDCLVGAASLAGIQQGARFGTSSPRRTAQVLHRRPDLEIVPLRGNVATRLAKLARGEVDATLLAAAGLDRLGLGDKGTPLASEELLPAPAQGAIGIEIRSDDQEVRDLIEAIGDRATRQCVLAERGLLAGLGGDCRSAVAALACIEDGAIRLRAEILTADGSEVRSGESRFGPDDVAAPAEFAAHLLAAASPALRALFRK
jgi:hydroxymethylbilane synthase